MNNDEIKDAIYDTLRLYYMPVSQNKLWKLVQEKFYVFVPIQLSNPLKMEKKLDQTRTFSQNAFKNALNELVEDGRVYLYGDTETKLGKKLYSAKIDFNELRDAIPFRLDFMLKNYREEFGLILNNLRGSDNKQRAKILWKLHLLLFTAENQVKLYFEIFPDKLDSESLLSRIKNMKNMLDNASRSMGVSNDMELIQLLLNEVMDTAIKNKDSIKTKPEFKN